MKYRNFELRLASLGHGKYSAVVTDSPYGQCQASFRLPPGLDNYRISPHRAGPGESRDLSPESALYGGNAEDSTLDSEQAGRLLFEAAFSGKVGDLFKKSHNPEYSLRIKLVLGEGVNDKETTLLHAQPWELLFYERHLAVELAYSVVRQLDGDLKKHGSACPSWFPRG